MDKTQNQKSDETYQPDEIEVTISLPVNDESNVRYIEEVVKSDSVRDVIQHSILKTRETMEVGAFLLSTYQQLFTHGQVRVGNHRLVLNPNNPRLDFDELTDLVNKHMVSPTRKVRGIMYSKRQIINYHKMIKELEAPLLTETKYSEALDDDNYPEITSLEIQAKDDEEFERLSNWFKEQYEFSTKSLNKAIEAKIFPDEMLNQSIRSHIDIIDQLDEVDMNLPENKIKLMEANIALFEPFITYQKTEIKKLDAEIASQSTKGGSK